MHILPDYAHVRGRAADGGTECEAAADSGWPLTGELAERMGVDRAYVSGLELGQRNPTVVTLWHMAKALGVQLGSFFTVEKSPSRRGR